MLKSLWAYRGFISSSVSNELITRFARSRLGGMWMIINPLAQAGIYALVLSSVLSSRLPGIDNKYAYSLYLLSGMLAWTLFSEILTRCLTLFIDNGALIKKVNFPKVTLPAILVGSALLNNAFLVVATLVIFIAVGHDLAPVMLMLVPLSLCVVAFATGLGLILGIMNVFVRDLGQVVPIVLQIGFWLTPVVYPIQVVPEAVQSLIRRNPMYHVVAAYQDVLAFSKMPDLSHLASLMVASLLLLMVGLFMFRRASPEVVDHL
ncbi:ABC transporter permease [Pseudoxanthomonas winnipegensis]|nr:ABC transporter permease [Pseudoxanthomonas winnipegensis]